MRFNRTFMELKHLIQELEISFILRFNRTFMELKHNKLIPLTTKGTVLIVPLWNWNFGKAACYYHAQFGFNRTFMELKQPRSLKDVMYLKF